MKELLLMIDLLKVEIEKAKKDGELFGKNDKENEFYYLGKGAAFSIAIDEAEKLLKSGREQQP